MCCKLYNLTQNCKFVVSYLLYKISFCNISWISDVNDNTPVFTTADITVNINEDATIGDTVATFAATDADIDDAGLMTLTLLFSNFY